MNDIKHLISRSIRNKLLVITGVSTTFVVLAAFYGLFEALHELSAVDNAAGVRDVQISLGLMLVAIIAAFFWFLVAVRKAIELPARKLVTDLERLAKGDFSSPITSSSRDEMGAIARSAEQIRIDLGRIIQEVKTTAQSLAQSSTNLADTAKQVTEGSHAQNDAAASSVATMEEMSASIALVAENADEVYRLSTTSLENTQEGNEKVSELIGEIDRVENAMHDISNSVREFISSAALITNMTQQVKDIADQTNLLALNAAIEAARAGEQGRGFAVVADEVRKLAEKSAQSASEIDGVTQSLSQQSKGVDAAIESGQSALRSSLDFVETVAITLAEANNAVSQAGAGVSNITSAVKEQSAASQQIALNVERIADMAEQNNDAINLTAQDASRLNELASRLQSAINHLKL